MHERRAVDLLSRLVGVVGFEPTTSAVGRLRPPHLLPGVASLRIRKPQVDTLGFDSQYVRREAMRGRVAGRLLAPQGAPLMCTSDSLHAIEGSPPQRPPRTLTEQAIAPEQEGWRVVAREASSGLVAAHLLREMA